MGHLHKGQNKKLVDLFQNSSNEGKKVYLKPYEECSKQSPSTTTIILENT